MPQRPEKSVCVFCGSRPGRDPAFLEAARAFGTALGESPWRLVYGAGDVGMMGAVAAANEAAGGAALGVVPAHLLERERAHGGRGTIVVTETMHERKKVMFMNAEAIVTLPGGPGSLDELFEVLTWRQLGLHAKPVFLLNVRGCWDPLVALLERIVANGFAEPSFLEFLEVVGDVPRLMARLEACLGGS